MIQKKSKSKWHYLGLSAIILVSIFLNFYKLGQEGYGNLYYAAAVKSMMGSWHNFFFNSFDPKGFITIDKPPLGFWLQTFSTHLFGFKGWSLFFPQALAGVLSVALLYHIVDHVFGPESGLLSALILTLTPMVIATDRTNEVDSMLMFVTLIATWALIRSSEQKPFKWLIVSFFFVGIGFNIKMMEAYLILPAFYLFYLLTGKLSWLQKFIHLLFATIVLAVVSLSWAAIVDSIPPKQRPYVGSTRGNSMIELAIGYNGINRIIGQHHSKSLNSWLPLSKYAGSILKQKQEVNNFHNRNLYTSQFKQKNNRNHFTNVHTKKLGLLRLFITPQLVGQLSWLLPAAFVSIISLLLVSPYRLKFDRKRQMAIFWVVWVLSMFVFFSHIANMMNSYYMVMLAPGIAALAGIGFKEMWDIWNSKNKAGNWLFPLALAINVLFETSVLWMYPPVRITFSFVILALTMIAFLCLLLIKKTRKSCKKGISILAVLSSVLSLILVPAVWSISPIQYGGSETKPFAGPELKTLTDRNKMSSNSKLENYLKENYRKGSFLLATLNATSAAPIFLDTNLPVMAMGGFKGSDPALTVGKLQRMANEGQIYYFLLQKEAYGNQQSAIINWIRIHCQVVPAHKWRDNLSKLGFGTSSPRLYEYVKKPILKLE